MSRAAIVKIGYIDGVVRIMSVIALFDCDNGDELARDYVKRHLVIPKDVANRVELLICDVDDSVCRRKTSSSHVRLKAVKTDDQDTVRQKLVTNE